LPGSNLVTYFAIASITSQAKYITLLAIKVAYPSGSFGRPEKKMWNTSTTVVPVNIITLTLLASFPDC